MVGVIGHIANPSLEDAVGLTTSAEQAGARWIGLADAFWWRDVWMLLAEVARATDRIEIGPAMTNPYLRHRFHTAAALATLHELAPGRVFCGIAAGGSELTVAAGVSRRDAAERVGELVDFIGRVATGDAMDQASGRKLEVPLAPTPVMIAGRGDAMLRAAGRSADRVLLWAMPASDLVRSIAVVREGAGGRQRQPELIWAPLVAHDDAPEASIMHVAVYASLNTAGSIREEWGLDQGRVEAMRAELVGGDLAAATALVPAPALADLVFQDADRTVVAERARSVGVDSLAVPGFAADTVGGHVGWASEVESLIGL
jgi:5,10-methylenetetrahydromethanopterin reductase